MNTHRQFTLASAYKHLVLLFRTMFYAKKARKLGLLDLPFIERIILGVTEVNGCAMCSYAHTKIALEAGMDKEEIEALLNGEQEAVPAEQLKAVLFGQHYAEENGKPSKAAWDEIVLVYGEDTAKGILSTIRKIMVGNIWGGVIGSLKNRIQKKKTDDNSTLTHELLLTLALFPFLPIATLHALISTIIKTPLIQFSENSQKAQEATP